MSDVENDEHTELPPLWQFIHPLYGHKSDDATESDDDERQHEPQPPSVDLTARPADYVKLSRRAPRLGQLLRYLAEMDEDEDVQQLLREKDPVTGQTLLQWAVLQNHFMLAEYLVRRLRRGAFGFDPDASDVVIFQRWDEMRAELPTTAEVMARQRERERVRAEQRAARHPSADDEDDEEEPEAMPEELVYESLAEYHEEWGDRGVGLVKRVGEVGLYVGARLRDGTRHGLGASLYANGDAYCGLYRNSQREGRGLYWWSAHGSTLYCGEWMQNLRHGYGRMVYADGSRYLGQWRDNRKHGRGRYTYADGSSYDGEWVGDEKHGQGTYTFADGSCHTGSFVHNTLVSGTWVMACGTVRYVGNFDPRTERPVGVGIFVHHTLNAEGTRVSGRFQREGEWRDGRWVPSAVKGTTRVTPYVEMSAPDDPTRRIPLTFTAHCVGRDMADLVRIANYAPLRDWVQEVHVATAGAARVHQIEVERVGYDRQRPSCLCEVCIRPVLTDPQGRPMRVHSKEDGTRGPYVTLTEPTSYVLVLLLPHPSCTTTTEPLVLLERCVRFAAPESDRLQSRLPRITVVPNASTAAERGEIVLSGPVVEQVGPVLRLELGSTRYMIPLLHPTAATSSVCTNGSDGSIAVAPSLGSNARVSVWLYAQELHADAFAGLEHKLRSVSAHDFLVVPLTDVAARSSDALTVLAAQEVRRRRARGELPQSTIAPQRPPTPLPPPPQPRPELQPLYDAHAARTAAEQESGEES